MGTVPLPDAGAAEAPQRTMSRHSAEQASKGIPESVALFGKRGFSDSIKLSILKWSHYPGLSGWVLNAITSVLITEGRSCGDGAGK